MNREFWDDMLKFGDTTRQWVEGQKYSCLKEVEFLGWIGLKSDVRVCHALDRGCRSFPGELNSGHSRSESGWEMEGITAASA